MGVVTTAVLSNMNQPLGRAIGNSLEIAESIECLHGKGPEDLVNLTCVLGKNESLPSSKMILSVGTLFNIWHTLALDNMMISGSSKLF